MHHLLQMFFGHPRYFAFRLFVVLSVTWYCWVRCLNPHYRSENKFMLFGVAVAFASKINFDGLEHSPRIVTDFGDGTVLTGGARVLDSLILLSAGLAVYACRQAVLKLERPLNYV